MTSSNGNIFRGIHRSPRSFDVFFDLALNKRLSKPSRRRWFETPSPLLWRHCNVCILRSQMQFLDTKLLCFDLIVIELCSYWGNWYQVSIGSGNGLAPHRQEAITRPPPVHCDLTNKMPQGTLQKTYLLNCAELWFCLLMAWRR